MTKNLFSFWDHREENGWLTNFWPSEVVIDGITWPTSEHYYQAMKHKGSDLEYKIRNQTSARKAKNLARAHPYPVRWTLEDKVYFMRKAIRAKFDQHPTLQKQLLDTGTAVLQEASPKDALWGEGSDGEGVNLMGLLLMELRAELSSTGKPVKAEI